MNNTEKIKICAALLLREEFVWNVYEDMQFYFDDM